MRSAAVIPALEGMPRHNSDGIGGMHVYVPWWELDKKNKDFPRGYHIEIGGGFGMPQIGSFRNVAARAEGYGSALKDDIRRYYGSQVNFSGRGEMIPNEHSFCEIDPVQVDQWGIPVLRFHWQWSEHEIQMVKHMHKTFTRSDRDDGRPRHVTRSAGRRREGRVPRRRNHPRGRHLPHG